MRPHSCCTRILYAEFKREVGLQRLGLRHTGPFCAGMVDGIVIGAWRAQGRLLPNGEVWRIA